MIIAIDFDETYNRSPHCFDDLIDTFWAWGHKVYIVTYRHETLDPDPLLDSLKKQGVSFVYTDGKAKDEFCKNLGIEVDIWIEDNPKAVYEDSAWKHDSPELNAWREENAKKLKKSKIRRVA